MSTADNGSQSNETYVFPASFAQQRLWLRYQIDPDGRAYRLRTILKVSGELHAAALERSLHEVMRRHEALRTTFDFSGGQLWQVVHPSPDHPLDLIDLSHLPEAERALRVEQIIADSSNQLFDLKAGPVLWARLLRCSDKIHYLILLLHHIVTDAWSQQIIWRELRAQYAALVAGEPSPLAGVPLQYADFAVWQRQWLSGRVLQEQTDYWTKQLAGPLPVLNLSTQARSPNAGSKSGRAQITLPAPLVESLEAIGRGEDATLFMTLLAAFQTLLHRYSQLDDIVVGTPVANRHYPGAENVVGFFVNMLAIRTDFAGNLSFRQLLRRLRRTCLQAYAYQDLPFDMLVEELRLPRDPAYPEVYQVLFQLQTESARSARFPGLDTERIAIDRDTAGRDLSMSISRRAEGWSVGLSYKTALFEPQFAQAMLDNFRVLLEALCAHPAQPLATLPLLSADERQRLLVSWNQTARSFPLDACFHHLFEQQVETTPAAIAACDAAGSVTYRELNARANRLARALVHRGAGPERIIALAAPRNIDFLTAILAIFKAGAVYLPLDPRSPPARHRQILGQSGAHLLLVSSIAAPPGDGTDPHAVAAGALATSTFRLEDLLAEAHPETNLPLSATPDHLAYVIYTSGSTGLPKGAMIEHWGMLNHLFAQVHDLQLSAADVIAQHSPQSFDTSLWQFLTALLVGGTTHIISEDVTADPAALVAQLDKQGITVFEAVPSLLRVMLDYRNRAGQPIALSKLRWLIYMGEAMPAELSRSWFQGCPQVRQMNAYGPAECSDGVTHYVTPEVPLTAHSGVPIGRPIVNLRSYILDQHMNPVPIGVTGDLYIGGIGVGRGYLNDPERTAAAFLPDPYAAECGAPPGTRLYHSGDLARYRADGAIEFLGRSDFQVKLRGQRIELGEIETALLDHPAVAECAVTVAGDEPASQRLVAFVAFHPGRRVGFADLSAHVQGRLPTFMIPSAYKALPMLPKTSSGKIDRRALAVVSEAGAGIGSGHMQVPPRTALEAQIAGVWSEVLGVDPIGVEDNFFELGGHSLMAAQLVYRLRETVAPGLPLAAFFQQPTVAGLAAQIDGADHPLPEQGTLVSLLSIRPLGQKLPFFFLPGGGGSEGDYLLYANLLNRLEPDRPLYGFQARGLDGETEVHATVQAMALDYVAEMRSVQPHGPYFLGGECIGGKAAYEMARQLRAQGEEVALLVMLNTFVRGMAEDRPPERRSDRATLARKVRARWRKLRQTPPRKRLARLWQMATNTATVLAPVTAKQQQTYRQRAVRMHYMSLLRDHEPGVYDGDVTLLMTAELRQRVGTEGWHRRVEGAVDVELLEGRHTTYLGDFAEKTAYHVNAALKRADGERLNG